MKPIRQQIVISGLGGQGVLFVTRLLAEAAMELGLPVLTAETHGMAQRGGTVLSHLKLGAFTSPLIRAATADGALILHAENLPAHGALLRSGGWALVNRTAHGTGASPDGVVGVDATAGALAIGQPRAVNLVLLGAALARHEQFDLFCAPDLVERVLRRRLAGRDAALAAALQALAAGARLEAERPATESGTI
jgi:indolepyruvate ferredoxin oxidoreductase beta subunit